MRQAMKDKLKAMLGERVYVNVREYANILHKGDVDAWIADVVLSIINPPEFEMRIDKLRVAHG